MAVGSINDLICNTSQKSQKLVACPHRIGVKMAKKHSMLPELFYISFFGVVFQNVWTLRIKLPIPSMYGIFIYIWLNLMVNVGKYTINTWSMVWVIWNSLCLSSGQMVTWVCINSRHPNIGRPLVGTINAGESAVVPKRWDFLQIWRFEAFQSLGLNRRVFLDGEIHPETWRRHTHTHVFLKKLKVFVGCQKKSCWRWVWVKFLEIPVFRWGGSQSAAKQQTPGEDMESTPLDPI